MNREEASNIWQIIKAYGEGATIEVYSEHYGKWIEPPEPLFNNDEKYRIKPEENYTIEQDFGVIEGGALSNKGHLCNEQEEKHYKPFEDTAELMVHYSKHFNIDFPPFYEPIIWVKRKDSDSRFLITGYDELDVFLEDCWQDLNDLYEQYVFLDGSPVGKLEE